MCKNFNKAFICLTKNSGYSKTLFYSKFSEKEIKNEIDNICVEIIKSCSIPFIHEQIKELNILINAYNLKCSKKG